jgi:hypothetical protein
MRLRVEFVNSGRPSPGRNNLLAKEQDKGLFWWAIVNTLLLGGAIASWFFSIYLFSYPERAFNYNLLSRLNKVDPLTRWQVSSVPSGKPFQPRAAFQEFERLSDEQLATKSALMKRSYITNYKSLEERPMYLSGKFKIYQVRPLDASDVFQNGLVVRAQAIENVDGVDTEFPNTLVEFIFPTDGPAQAAFNVNDVLAIDLAKPKRSYASILNVERLPGKKLLFTVVPLLYGTYDLNKEEGVQLTLAPPKSLNMAGNWPLTEEGIGVTALAPAVAPTSAPKATVVPDQASVENP